MPVLDLLTAPWAIDRASLLQLHAIYERHARGEKEDLQAVATRLGRPLQNARRVEMRGATAVVPIVGPIFRYANLFTEISGATSLEILAKDVQAALDNPSVAQIVLSIDSPGGQASGIAELAQLIRSAGKPVIAYVDQSANSAAYWLATAADQIVMAKTAIAGSIGAVLTIDQRSSDGQVTIVSSQSPAKLVDVTTDDGKARVQRLVDDLAQVFVADVAQYRGTTVDVVLQRFGGGDVFIAAEAVKRGMADKIGTLETLLAELAGAPVSKGQSPMSTQSAAQAALTLDALRAEHPEVFQAARTIGANEERERIRAVEAQAMPGHEELIARLKFDGKTTGPEAAVQVLAAERASLAERAERVRRSTVAPVPFAVTPRRETSSTQEADSGEPLDEKCKREWAASAELQGEFSSLAAYTAYCKAMQSGSARVFRAA